MKFAVISDIHRNDDILPVERVFVFTQDDLQKLERIKGNHSEKLVKIVSLHLENIGKTTDNSNRTGCYIRKF